MITPTAIGGTLTGYGKVDSIDSIPVGNLCTDGELTYYFSGYALWRSVVSVHAPQLGYTPR